MGTFTTLAKKCHPDLGVYLLPILFSIFVWGCSVQTTCLACNNGLPTTEGFDVEARIAEIEAAGGVHSSISIASGDVFLEITDPESPIFGVAVSIPADAISSLPRSLLSIEPHDGPALSLSFGQSLVGPVFDVQLIAIDTGAQVSLPSTLGRVYAPFDLSEFGASFTETAVFLGLQFSQFSDALTAVSGRGIDEIEKQVSGLVSKFGVFVAFHDEAATGGKDDTTDPTAPPTGPPDVASTELWKMNLSGGSVCTKNASTAGFPRNLTLRLTDGGSSSFYFTAQDGTGTLVEYRIGITAPSPSLPTGSGFDPGFPGSATSYEIKIACKPTSQPQVVVENNQAAVTDPAALNSLGINQRSVLVRDWFTTTTQEGTCNGTPCHIHTGWAWVIFSPLEMTDQTTPSATGRFELNSYMSGAMWEIPK